MATYAIGDVHGCADQLEQLLESIRFDATADTLWFVGDLINRGPDSLGTLRLLYEIRDRIECVLGNHEMILLQAAQKGSDAGMSALRQIIDAPDGEKLLRWVRTWGFAHTGSVEGEGGKRDYLMVHAGVAANQSLAQVCALSEHLHSGLSAEQASKPDQAQRRLLTCVRYVDAEGEPDYSCNRPPDQAPQGLKPWFLQPLRIRSEGCEILFGHWASARGHTGVPGVHALDAGCVWGGELKAMRLEDQCVFCVPGLAA